MQCPSCGAASEGRFCTSCGTDLSPPAYLCVSCGASFSTREGCPVCGTPVGAAPGGSVSRTVGSLSWTFAILLFLFFLVAELVALAYTAGAIVEGALAGGPRVIPLYLLAPFPVGDAVDVSAEVFVLYFFGLVAVILGAYAWYAIQDGKATVAAFARPLPALRPRLESRSAFVVTGQVWMAALFFQVVFILALSAGGYDPPVPQLPPGVPLWYEYFALANASVYEEVVTRWLFIGVPLAVFAWSQNSETRRPWRHLLGGTVSRTSPRPIVLVAIFLVIGSSVVFGLAHVPAWGWWKFLPTFVAGLGMGYLFIRRGFLAGVLFHFATDYLAVLGQLTGDNLGAQVLLGLFLLLIFGFGLFFFVWYCVHGIQLVSDLLVRWGYREPVPIPTMRSPPAFPPSSGAFGPIPRAVRDQPRAEPPPYGSGFVPFVCAQCGWDEARYAEGHFTCLRCGRVTP